MSAVATIAPFEPYATKCSRFCEDSKWTCPGCFHDLGDVGAGTHWCPKCGRGVICTVDSNYPACHALLKTQENEE